MRIKPTMESINSQKYTKVAFDFVYLDFTPCYTLLRGRLVTIMSAQKINIF